MAIENATGTAESEPYFNFEVMPLDIVRTVHRALFESARATWKRTEGNGPEWSQIEAATESFRRDLERLPYRNIERARELILTLARSEQPEDKDAAATPLCWLLRRECELGTEDVTDQIDLLAGLVHGNDNHGLTSELTYLTVGKALNERWWPEPIATAVDQATTV